MVPVLIEVGVIRPRSIGMICPIGSMGVICPIGV